MAKKKKTQEIQKVNKVESPLEGKVEELAPIGEEQALDDEISKQFEVAQGNVEPVQKPEEQKTKHKVVTFAPKKKKSSDSVYEYMSTKDLRKYAKAKRIHRFMTRTRRGLITALKKMDKVK